MNYIFVTILDVNSTLAEMKIAIIHTEDKSIPQTHRLHHDYDI